MGDMWGIGATPVEQAYGCEPAGSAAMHYGAPRLPFRAAPQPPRGKYLVTLGGSETFGRAVEVPYPALLATALGVPVLNLGCVNAGPDLWLSDAVAEGVIGGASAGVLQVVGALNLSNRFYAVHPRRNDRFVEARPELRRLYRDVDFTEINFTRHLAMTLHRACPERFALVARELKSVWVQRMRAVLERMPGLRILYWVADRPPPLHADRPDEAPALVDRAMIDAVRPLVTELVEHVLSRRALAIPATGALPRSSPFGEEQHHEAARRLVPVLDKAGRDAPSRALQHR